MKFQLGTRNIDVFTISPKTTDTVLYWKNIELVTRLSQQFDCTGVLIYTGNDVYVDPWIVAHNVLLKTQTLCPLVAVNPIYMHPYTAAKLISSFAYLYQRKIYLNLVTGTALSYLEALGDKLSHDERYERLREYVRLISLLLESPGLVSFSGKFYQVSNLGLVPKIAKSLTPGFLLAGQSEAAQKTCELIGATSVQNLAPELEQAVKGQTGIHFGIIARDTESQAWRVAASLFPENPGGSEMLEFSVKNTDSVWWRQMKLASDETSQAPTNYWLKPFKNYQADCAYIVGDYDCVATLLISLIERGISTFILEIPPREEEFYHVNAAFNMAASRLQLAGAQASLASH